MRPLLSLVMIVRDEAARIAETITSARGAIDRFTILDTGSTDGTPEIVEKLARDFGLPGRVHREAVEGPFDYASARNRALALEVADPEAACFALILSGDEVLRCGAALRQFLEARRDAADDGAYLVRMSMEESEWVAARAVRLGAGWVWESVGGVQEYLVNYARGGGRTPGDHIPGEISIRHEVSDPERRLRSIVEHQIPALSAVIEERPDDPRALLFLAQAIEVTFPFLEAGPRLRAEMEAMSLYLHRMRLGGDGEEARYARARYLEVARRTGVYSSEELVARFAEACEMDPDRPECRLFLAISAHEANRSLGEVRALALEAARVAEASRERRQRFPRSTSCLWRALVIAARSSRKAAIGSSGEEREACLAEVRVLAERAREAGCPEPVCSALLSPLPVPDLVAVENARARG